MKTPRGVNKGSLAAFPQGAFASSGAGQGAEKPKLAQAQALLGWKNHQRLWQSCSPEVAQTGGLNGLHRTLVSPLRHLLNLEAVQGLSSSMWGNGK